MNAQRKNERGNGVVRVASGQGFWGDWLEAPRRQVEGGEIDYLMLDYLAEVTMSILQRPFVPSHRSAASRRRCALV
jgi:hypothetical protein